MELPKWRSHKVVQAAKIIGYTAARDGGSIGWTLELDGGSFVTVSSTFIVKVPAAEPAGGYYVRYEDGYESWSPAKAFEEGYTLVVPESRPMYDTAILLADWRARLVDGDVLSKEEINELFAMARRGADPTPPAPNPVNGKLLSAAWSGLSKVSIEVEPGVRQIWVKGAETRE